VRPTADLAWALPNERRQLGRSRKLRSPPRAVVYSSATAALLWRRRVRSASTRRRRAIDRLVADEMLPRRLDGEPG
jgi:hypothetical protein